MHTKFASITAVFSLFIIFFLGLLMIFSTTSAEILDHARNKSTHSAFIKQIAYAVAGLFLAYAFFKVGYEKFISYSPYLLFFFTLLLIFVLLPGFGKEVNGSKRWLNIAGVSFQPSEFLKYIAPAFFIHKYSQNLDFKGFLKIIGTISISVFLILIEPNNGTAFAIGCSFLALFLLAGVPFKFWAFPLAGCLFIGGIFASQLPYVQGRLSVYMNPELDLKGKGHQPHQAKIAVGSGQWLGRGPGNSLQKLSYLPEAQNDYIAAIYAEETGFIGILALITLYLMFASSGVCIALNAHTDEGLVFAGVILFLIIFQAFLNMGVVSGLLPSTGLNLPLFSQGGSSLMANMAGIGLLLSIGKKT